jgi:hypothetical protein
MKNMRTDLSLSRKHFKKEYTYTDLTKTIVKATAIWCLVYYLLLQIQA